MEFYLGGLASLLGAKRVRSTRFAQIGAGTSGSVTLPANSTVILDDFGGTTDAVVTTMSGGKPAASHAVDGSGNQIATTFDASGNYAFSGTPSAYPVALVYRVDQSLEDFDSTSSDIIGWDAVFADGTLAGVTSPLTVSSGVVGLAGLTGLGTANQAVAMNASATGYEYKTFSTGSSGTDFAIAHTAGVVTFNIPTTSASNRGLVTSALFNTWNAKQDAITASSPLQLSAGSLTIKGLSTFGSANQIFGINSGATQAEYKTLSVGTSGSDFAIAHGAGTVAFNLPTASATVRGALSSTDWSTFNGKQAALTFTSPLNNVTNVVSVGSLSTLGSPNRLVGVTASAGAWEYKTFATGTSGTDFAIVHTANTVTFNIPNASTANRGVVNTSTQTFTGAKEFDSAASFTSTQTNASGDRVQIFNSQNASAPIPVRYSPRLNFKAASWNTTGGGSNYTHNWGFEVIPVSSTAPISSLGISNSKNGAAYTYIATFSDNGTANFMSLSGAQGGTPTIAAGTGAGTGPTVTVVGNNIAHQVSITTGTLPTLSATIAEITYSVAKTGTLPKVVLSPRNANAALLTGATMVYVSASSTSKWTLTAGSTALTAATTYLWDAIVIE